jgi:polyphosphate:AMP phosphotransferase
VFRTAELGQSVSDKAFAKRELELRVELLDLQYRALNLAQFPVIVDFAGVDGAGKGTTVNMLNKWMDPRWIRTIGYQPPSTEESARPRFWRYWRDLPPKGWTGLYLSGRYSQALLKRVYGELDASSFDERLAQIIRFENTLADDGALILKFWMHLSKQHQKQRLETLAADPALSYRVSDEDWRNREHYDDFIDAGQKIITRTSRGNSPWHIIEGVDSNFRHLEVGEIFAAALTRHLENHERAATDATKAPPADKGRAATRTRSVTVLDRLDMSLRVPQRNYRRKLKKYQSRLGEFGREAARNGISSVLVFEGPDASGKGGAIRRTVWSLDARWYRVFQFAAPTDVEAAHHYLWRFWQKLPGAGKVCIFDRSWYGRVLVERNEGFATEDEWRRAYAEINDFEQQIVDRGSLLLKFWLQISADEQLSRFEKRAKSPYKQWKLTDEDWRNREQWDAYQVAAHDMVQYTHTRSAPWVLVEADSKQYARLKVLGTLVEHLEAKLESAQTS